jgi:hypothetical protein
VLDFLAQRAANVDGLLQTYDPYEGKDLEKRHDIYDNALAAILFDMHGEYDKAQSILSAFVKLMEDVKPNGRLAAAYGPDGKVLQGRMDAGNNAWVITALAYHGKLKPESGMLDQAKDLKDRLKKEHGFRSPFDLNHPHSVEQEAKSGNCSTENTTDLITSGRICEDEALFQVCCSFVNALWNPTYDGTPAGAYLVGTNPDGTLDNYPLPCDCQTWTLLADADMTCPSRGSAAMDAVLTMFYRTDKPPGYAGVLFSNAADTGIQMENTASAAMAMAKYVNDSGAGDALKTRLTDALQAIDSTLTKQVSDHNGGVLAAITTTASGYGYDYYPTVHLASTVWTGMYFGAARAGIYDEAFNPYQVGK